MAGFLLMIWVRLGVKYFWERDWDRANHPEAIAENRTVTRHHQTAARRGKLRLAARQSKKITRPPSDDMKRAFGPH
jgi:hypothetical protein